jgi:hypothetical protein
LTLRQILEWLDRVLVIFLVLVLCDAMGARDPHTWIALGVSVALCYVARELGRRAEPRYRLRTPEEWHRDEESDGQLPRVRAVK